MPRMYRTLPYQGGDARLVSEVVNNAMNGKTNNSGTFTLATSVTETTVNTERAGFDSIIVLSPTTANAATEIPYTYIKTKAKGSFIIGHRNTSNTDVTYDYIIVG
tara:strand:+ start:200 stop:514 length:315 start_codon:yes stop_codon:yes gene_type:complete